MKAVIKAGEPVPVLLTPDTTAGAVVGLVPGGSTVEVAEVITGEQSLWAKLVLFAGDIQLLRSDTRQPLFGYIAAQYIVGGLETAETQVRVGLSVIYQRDSANLAVQAGCRFFSIIGHVELASEIKAAYPDAIVMIRPYIDIRGTLPSAEYIISRLNGARDPGLIYTGINEADQIGQGTGDIRKRAQLDVDVAQRIKAISGAVYAAGSFSMGTPDFTNPGVCDEIRTYYAPHYNSGLLWWDNHLYSPNPSHIYREDIQTPIWNGVPQVVVEHEWYETRWRFLFTRCGFDPNSTSRVVSSETGLDEGSVGGFVAHNSTNDDVLAWCKRFLQIESLPLVLNGVSYPSPFVGGAIFQIGEPTNWAGYDMTRYLNTLRDSVWLPPKSKLYIPMVSH